MKSISIAAAFVFLVHHCTCFTNYISHIQNYVNLVSAYSQEGYSTVDFPPLHDFSKAMEVDVGIYLYALNGFDEVAGNIELVAGLDMSWQDEMSVIQSIQFTVQDRREFLIPYDKIWTPKLVLVNAIGDTSEVGALSYICRYNMMTHRVTWKPRIVISGSCTPDVTYYPFDTQQCNFIYTPWGFKADEVRLLSKFSEWNLDEYGLSGEWDIATTTTKNYTQKDQSYIEFTISIVRKPLYFAFNILIPVLVLCLLNSTVFLLPAESGERVGFSVTCFLSFMVLLNMIMDIMPRSSSPISLLCFYLVVMLANSGAMTLFTILLMRVYHKPEKSKVPIWLQRTVTFIRCGCARIRCCVLCCRLIRSKCKWYNKKLCGCCRKNSKKVTDDELIEVTVTKHNGVIEKTVKSNEENDTTNVSKETKCCSILCFRHRKNSESKCCCGCVLKVRKCYNKPNTQEDSKCETKEPQMKTGCCCFPRKNELNHEYDMGEGKHDNTGENSDQIEENAKEGETGKQTSIPLFKKIKREEIRAAENGKDYSIKTPKTTRDVDLANEQEENNVSCLPFWKTKVKQLTEGSERKSNPSENGKIFKEDNKPTIPNIKEDILPDTKQTSAKDILETNTNLLQLGWLDFESNKKASALKPLDQNCVVDKNATDVNNGHAMIMTKSSHADSDEDEVQTKASSKAKTDKVNKQGKSRKATQRSKSMNKESRKINSAAVSMRSSLRSTKFELESNSSGASDSEDETLNDTNGKVIHLKTPQSSRRNSKSIPRSPATSRVSVRSRHVSESDESDVDVDSLADLEEVVEWPEVGRILDTFFFLAFSGGQIFVTVVFLVPIFTNTSGQSSDGSQ